MMHLHWTTFSRRLFVWELPPARIILVLLLARFSTLYHSLNSLRVPMCLYHSLNWLEFQYLLFQIETILDKLDYGICSNKRLLLILNDDIFSFWLFKAGYVPVLWNWNKERQHQRPWNWSDEESIIEETTSMSMKQQRLRCSDNDVTEEQWCQSRSESTQRQHHHSCRSPCQHQAKSTSSSLRLC